MYRKESDLTNGEDRWDPDKRDRLIKGLDVFLERDRDRELFELAPNKEIFDGNPG